MRLLKRFLSEDKASTAVEFGMVAMGFIAMVFFILEVARVYWSWNTLQYAVENATRYALTEEDVTEEQLQDYVRTNMPGFGSSEDNPTVEVSWETLSNVTFIQVNAEYEFDTIVGAFIPSDLTDLTLRATSRLPVP